MLVMPSVFETPLSLAAHRARERDEDVCLRRGRRRGPPPPCVTVTLYGWESVAVANVCVAVTEKTPAAPETTPAVVAVPSPQLMIAWNSPALAYRFGSVKVATVPVYGRPRTTAMGSAVRAIGGSVTVTPKLNDPPPPPTSWIVTCGVLATLIDV